MPWNDNLDEKDTIYALASDNSKTIRVIAGPGTGKTFGIKRRITRLIEEGTKPDEILVITFTRTAAQDLKKEISALKIEGADKIEAKTIHSHALKILMQEEVLRITGRIPRMVLEHEIEPALRDIDDRIFGDVKDKKDLKDNYLAARASLQGDTPGFTKNNIQQEFEKKLISRLNYHECMLIGEIIPLAIDYLRNNPASQEINKYKYILVDEYQDLNKSEQEYVRLIRGDADLLIVGDDDQSIYSFKFAHPEGIRELEKLHGEYRDMSLSECRRCPCNVVKLASKLISQNSNRTLGDLLAFEKNPDGEINRVQWDNHTKEAEGLSEMIIKEIKTGKIRPKDVLVLSPRRIIGYKIRDILLANGLPVVCYFRESAIKKLHVKEAYSLLNLLAYPEDKVALRFLLSSGSGDYKKNQYLLLSRIAEEQKTSILNILNGFLKDGEKPKGITTILNRYRTVLGLLANLKITILESPEDAFWKFFIKSEANESDYYEINEIYKSAIGKYGAEEFVKSDNFEEGIKKVFNSIQEALALPDGPEGDNAIRIMSLHASKGLSAGFVVLCSVIEGFLPSPEHDIEEQRRLLYVATTRCKTLYNENQEVTYNGKLIISSFLSISIQDAKQMGIKSDVSQNSKIIKVVSSRFMKDYGPELPLAIAGKA